MHFLNTFYPTFLLIEEQNIVTSEDSLTTFLLLLLLLLQQKAHDLWIGTSVGFFYIGSGWESS